MVFLTRGSRQSPSEGVRGEEDRDTNTNMEGVNPNFQPLSEGIDKEERALRKKTVRETVRMVLRFHHSGFCITLTSTRAVLPGAADEGGMSKKSQKKSLIYDKSAIGGFMRT